MAALEADRSEGRSVLAAVHALSAKMDARLGSLDAKVDMHHEENGRRFDALETKVDGLGTKVDTLEVKAEVQRNVTNALGQRTWEMSKKLDEHIAKCDATNERLFGEIAILRGGQRSLDESNAELKDLMLQVLDRGTRTEFGGE
ncbi:hypothetical protein AWN90_26570 [Nocardia terpenica]|uniref:Uncharacterized protein n=1 Tax=Nocardia terpenica TaxID=455432 RepID=A0A164LGH6_9NOCA|nr:hypothetical protein AWN90_26570 [Nocardia terpenica]